MHDLIAIGAPLAGTLTTAEIDATGVRRGEEERPHAAGLRRLVHHAIVSNRFRLNAPPRAHAVGIQRRLAARVRREGPALVPRFVAPICCRDVLVGRNGSAEGVGRTVLG